MEKQKQPKKGTENYMQMETSFRKKVTFWKFPKSWISILFLQILTEEALLLALEISMLSNHR